MINPQPQAPATAGEMQQQMADLGKRLALLLVSSDLPDEVKQAWADLIPEMTLAQLDKLAGALEKEVSSGVAVQFADFRADLSKIESAHQTKVEASQQTALDQLAALEQSLPQS